jgi:outer membrane protein assembly factor BamB
MNRLLPWCVLLLPAVVQAGDWPQWRGPKNDGIAPDKGVALRWSADSNVKWKLKMPGMGSSTPCISKGKLFFTSQAGSEVVLVCASTEGKELWRKPLGQNKNKPRGDEGNDASASPSTDGTHVYVFAGTGLFAAFDFEGKEVWSFNAQDRYGKFKIQFGLHSTPLLHQNRLYMQLIHSGGATVFAVDKKTGKEVWKITRESDGTDENEHSYASCFLWTNLVDAYLVVHGNDYATAHALADGKEIWRVGDLNPREKYNRYLRFVSSPVCTPDLIVVPSAKNGPVVGVKPDATGKVMRDSKHVQWRITNGTPDVPSPLVHGGLVYLVGEGGRLTVLDAKTGKEQYKKPLKADRYRASPVVVEGHLIATAREGVFSVAKLGATAPKIEENKLPDRFTASPAISDGVIYLRGHEYLWAIAPSE